MLPITHTSDVIQTYRLNHSTIAAIFVLDQIISAHK